MSLSVFWIRAKDRRYHTVDAAPDTQAAPDTAENTSHERCDISHDSRKRRGRARDVLPFVGRMSKLFAPYKQFDKSHRKSQDQFAFFLRLLRFFLLFQDISNVIDKALLTIFRAGTVLLKIGNSTAGLIAGLT